MNILICPLSKYASQFPSPQNATTLAALSRSNQFDHGNDPHWGVPKADSAPHAPSNVLRVVSAKVPYELLSTREGVMRWRIRLEMVR